MHNMDQGGGDENVTDQPAPPRRSRPAASQDGDSGSRNNQPQVLPQRNCPRCDSNNTKFCYYNNYSLAQPRYFCRTCRRYWTQGGTLRNVPVGGGCRKGRRNRNAPVAAAAGAPAVVAAGASAGSTSEIARVSLPAAPPNAAAQTLSTFGGLSTGFLPPLGNMQQGFGMNQVGSSRFGFGTPSSTMSLLQGLNFPALRAAAQQQNQQFFQPQNNPNFPSQPTSLIPTRPLGNWAPSFINNNNSATVTPNLWNNPVGNMGRAGSSGSGNEAGTPVNPNPWSGAENLPGFNPSQ